METLNLVFITLVLVSNIFGPITALENGLARTPPMGWLSWERFRCNIDCVNDPENCISENLYKTMADLLVSEGYAAVGYDTVIMDDCWMAAERAPDGSLLPDPDRFPSGMKALGDYIHNLGLKFGVYEDYGNTTCAGYPGVIGHMQQDAQTIADWGADYIKLDGCASDPADMDVGFPLFGEYLNETGRPIVYLCEWPLYQVFAGINPDWDSIKETCNLWRNYVDVQDSWASVEDIINYYGHEVQDEVVANAGPGHWNDPDMIIVGDFGLSLDQSRAQMALWSIFAAPLIMSNDLRHIEPVFKEILQNKDVIAVNQDVMGKEGRLVYEEYSVETWTRPILPQSAQFYSYAVAWLNRRTDGTPYRVSVQFNSIGLTSPGGYFVTDLFDGTDYGIILPSQTFTTYVNPTGVVFLKCTVVGYETPSKHL